MVSRVTFCRQPSSTFVVYRALLVRFSCVSPSQVVTWICDTQFMVPAGRPFARVLREKENKLKNSMVRVRNLVRQTTDIRKERQRGPKVRKKERDKPIFLLALNGREALSDRVIYG